MAFPWPTFTKSFHSSIYPAIDPSNPALSVKSKIILVTGGGKGVGKHIATVFATAGASTVVILGRATSSLQAAEKDISAAAVSFGHETIARSFAVDICDAEAVSRTVRTVCEEFGTIDVFVHNAGDLQLGTIESSNAEEYWHSFEVNVKGTLNCMQAFTRFGVRADDTTPPTFINVSTMGIHMAPVPTMSAYSASKLAAWKMAEYLHVEMGAKLRVFSIHPGRIETDMSRRAGIPAADDKELPGAFCLWLAATPGVDFLRGRMLTSNWDVSELLERKDEIVEKDLLVMTLAGWRE
ncbi:putative short-chain dehydrogenase [Mytilinidion resinicola]|uniref:Short-chain dehydrogenase n=1 Tax=Mytilinidion resinicola TaxID=574789 RepID=A0A6A6Y6G3_9PEZI|nr:putative short-chain dehydrogenase [Mytilinidion resinicola]KAF2803604.1 putative short-chain dehydrogenase [Mytilinidion resinicola]